jgi:hypothetical protein
MAYKFVVPERDQLYLLPTSLSDWLPEDHLAWSVLNCVEEMDLDSFYAKYREDGWGGALTPTGSPGGPRRGWKEEP